MKQRNRGFTLVELMVTIMVLAILLGFAIPSFNTIVRNNRLVAHANAMVGTLNSARAEAIAQKRAVAVCGSEDGASCAGDWVEGWVSFIDADGDGIADPAIDTDGDGNIDTPAEAITILRVMDSAPPDVELTFSGGAGPVRYNSLGYALAGSAGTFLFCDPRGDRFARAVLVAPTGRVSTAIDTDGDGVVNDASGENVTCPNDETEGG